MCTTATGRRPYFGTTRVLYVSTHQWPFYPGTGEPEEVGGCIGQGLTVNVPLPAGATGDVVRRALDDVAAPAIDAFAPTWVLVSAGFDAHRGDPLADLALSGGDFAALARMVSAFAPRPGPGAVPRGGVRPGRAADVGCRHAGSINRCVADGSGGTADLGGPGAEFVERAAGRPVAGARRLEGARESARRRPVEDGARRGAK